MLAEEIRKREEGKGKRGKGKVEFYGPLRLVRRGSTAAPSGTSPRVRRALEYIRRNACSQSIFLDRIIEEMGCSRRMGTLQFKKETGRTMLAEIHEHRFEKACDLLSRTRLPISTVVAHCGYRSDAFIKKMFLARTGLTMREYRKSRTGSSHRQTAQGRFAEKQKGRFARPSGWWR